MRTIRFSIREGYDAIIGRGAVKALALSAACALHGQKAAVITDSGVPEAHVNACISALTDAGFETPLFVMPMGEQNKTLSTLEDVYGFLYDNGISRTDGVLGVGGGFVGDVAGFAAATYSRGIPFISVPTTIIAQTDSAYGGKTGVDLRSGKNMIGCFSHPKAVVCDVDFLDTLGKNDRVSGMGEVIKYGAIAEPSLLKKVRFGIDEDDISLCVDIKRRYVEADEFDLNERRVLNFGHTYGHAFEAASGYTLPHGQAVAYGMLASCRLGEILGLTPREVYGDLEEACRSAGLDTTWEDRISSALPMLSNDKKRDGGLTDFVLLNALGEPVRKQLTQYELRLTAG